MTVFLIHEPVRWNGSRMVALDMSPAKDYGELKVIFPGQDRPPCVAEAMPAIADAMGLFTENDYLVIAGDMDLLIWAAALALENTKGKVRLLRWDNRGRRYEVSEAPTEYFN